MRANGAKIAELRKTHGLSTIDLAGAADRTQRWVQLVEKGKVVDINLNIAKALARRLGVKLEEIAKA